MGTRRDSRPYHISRSAPRAVQMSRKRSKIFCGITPAMWRPVKKPIMTNGASTTASVSVPSVLLQPEWVTPKNMNATVIKDNFVPASQLCAGSYAADCKAAGITG